MLSDATEETLTLRMGDLQLQLPRTTLPSSILPSSSPPPLFSSLKSELDAQDHGLDFYSSLFDNSFPYRGILANERTFSSSSTASNTSFLSETSFTQTLKSSLDNGSSSDGFGLLTTSTSFRGTENTNGTTDITHLLNGSDGGGSFLSQGSQLNDSGASSSGISSQRWDGSPPRTATGSSFDYPFPTTSESVNTSSVSSVSTADSSPRLGGSSNGVSSLGNQWNSSDVASLLDDSAAESPCSSSMVTSAASILANSIWSSSQITASLMGNSDQQWDDAWLNNLTQQQLLTFVELLQKKYDESVRDGDIVKIAQLQGVMVQAQKQIISSFVSDSGTSSASTPTTTIPSPLPLLPSPTSTPLDKVAMMHREIAGSKDAPYTWSGQLPPRIHRNPTYSSKVFLGGLPWDITEMTLMQSFKMFGIIRIEWPGKDGVTAKPKGYAYAVFENEKQVKLLLQNCTHDFSSSRVGKFYFKISSKKYRGKDVQIIPWALSESNFVKQASKIDSQKTIFVGALHGMVNAEGLAHIMNDLFGGVVYAGIDTDRHKYPIGSARVTFNNTRSYMKAVSAAFVYIKTSRFEKKLQVDPYLEDATCSVCNLQQGPYFCRDNACFRYFCRTCFQTKHSSDQFRNHRPLMRTTNNKQHGGISQVVQAPFGFGSYSSSGFGNSRPFCGRSSPPMCNGSVGMMSGKFNNFNHGGYNGGGGGSCGGGHNFMGHGQYCQFQQQQMSHRNNNFGRIGHGQQQQNYMRW